MSDGDRDGDGAPVGRVDRVTALPRLREGVVLETSDAGHSVLSDPELGRRIKLDPRGTALCRELARDVTRGEDAIGIEDLADALACPVDLVEAFAAKLVALDLVATERAKARLKDRRALAAVRAAPAEHLRVLAGARFECTMCGSCCGGHNIGPVSPKVLVGLDAVVPELEPAIREARRVDKQLFVVLQDNVMCHTSDGSCLFLDDGGRCRIHAKLGGNAKPLPCRIFPWELVATPSGVRVTVQRECRDFVRATAEDRPLLSEATAELSGLLRELEQLPVARLTTRLRGRELAAWAEWEALEGDLLGALETVDGVDQAEVFRALVARLPPPSGATGTAGGGFSLWRERLLGVLERMLRAAPPANERMVIRIDALEATVEALGAAHGWVLKRALAPLDGEAGGLLVAHLRHALWATTPLMASSVEAGIGRLFAEWLLARLIAIVRAREVKRFHITTQDLQDGLVVATFLFRHEDLEPLLSELDDMTASVFVDGLDELLTEAALAGEPERRLELVKF
jgi:Fe-S-cluster containining protein